MTETHTFEAFMQAYQDMVFTTAMRLLANETDAEDVAQEVFMKAYSRFDELSGNPAVGGWLKTVTRNLCLNHLTRYRARWKMFTDIYSEDEENSSFVENLSDPRDESKTFGESDRYQILEEALQKLPVSQRVPLVLFHFEEMSYEEIARKLGVSLSKVKTDIHRGRETLYHQMKPECCS